MQVIRFLLPLACLLTACSADPPLAQQAPVSQAVPKINLGLTQKRAIGRKIWQNESGGRVEGLTAWNQGEEFPSLGIGHFIWYPRGFRGPYTESFPQFVKFAQARSVVPPDVALLADCPWPSRAAFQRDFNGPRLTDLRRWLKITIPQQTEFIIQKSQAALPKIMRTASPADAARIQQNYQKVATTTNGIYALIDYVNFKGEGINPKERYAGFGWGLKQVLLGMANVPSGQAAAREFAASAKRQLDLRIKNSPPARGEGRWRDGWHNRCNTYAQAF